MCNHTLLRFRKQNPICFALIITMIITLLIIVIALIVYGIQNIGTSFENESDIKKTEKEKDKDKVEDVDIEFHIKKHKAELEHKKEMDAAEKSHELLKIGIILPVCGIFVTALCLTLIVIYRKNIATLFRAKSNVKVEAQHSKPNDRLKLPKSKINDFKTLINMGFDKKDIVTALNETKTIGFALDRLTTQNEARIYSRNDMD